MNKNQNHQSAIMRKLSPLQQTASVAGFKSTRELGAVLTPQDLEEELRSREMDRRLGSS